MANVAVLFGRPVAGIMLSVEPELASWDRAGSMGQIRPAAFLAHVNGAASNALAEIRGPVAVELLSRFILTTTA
jgi:hypothetical protein